MNINVNYTNSEDEKSSIELLGYGLPLIEVYKLALNFYKDKEGKAVHFSYEDKLQLVAFSHQVSHGPLLENINKLPPLGTFDVVGKDRRDAWHKLGNLTSDQARLGFIELLGRRCPLFSTFVEAHRREKDEKERRTREIERRRLLEEEERKRREKEQQIIKEQAMKEEAIRKQIQEALNEQTYEQFKKYAEQQFPDDPDKQSVLVKQLQDQHYIQYIQQLKNAQKNEKSDLQDSEEDKAQQLNWNDNSFKEEINESDSNHSNSEITMVPASMWTRDDIKIFKQSVVESDSDGVIRVGHGETVTVRVPTNVNSSRIFWEFATDSYDIGFGIYFEHVTPTTSQVSVHVSESDEEDMDDTEEEIYDEEGIRRNDIENGKVMMNAITKPMLSEIVPVYRRDCHLEVYAGSHQYSAPGIYLLKFDNSYSLWRSKTLYYRVCYTE